MSLIYLAMMVAVGAVLLFVMADAAVSVSRRPAWQTPHERLASEGATLHYLPPAAARPAPAVAAAVVREEEEALAA